MNQPNRSLLSFIDKHQIYSDIAMIGLMAYLGDLFNVVFLMSQSVNVCLFIMSGNIIGNCCDHISSVVLSKNKQDW